MYLASSQYLSQPGAISGTCCKASSDTRLSKLTVILGGGAGRAGRPSAWVMTAGSSGSLTVLIRRRTGGGETEELPHSIFAAYRQGQPPPSFISLFDGVCNETPATKELITGALLKLRTENEIEILTADGRSRPRTANIDDSDVLVPAKQRSLFSGFVGDR